MSVAQYGLLDSRGCQRCVASHEADSGAIQGVPSSLVVRRKSPGGRQNQRTDAQFLYS